MITPVVSEISGKGGDERYSKGNKPMKFTEIISYKKTSITPLDAFSNSNLTSVLDVITKGNGIIPANFRLIPGIAREKTIEIINRLDNSTQVTNKERHITRITIFYSDGTFQEIE